MLGTCDSLDVRVREGITGTGLTAMIKSNDLVNHYLHEDPATDLFRELEIFVANTYTEVAEA